MMQENSFGAGLEMKYQVRQAGEIAEQARLIRLARNEDSGFTIGRFLAPLGSGLERVTGAIRAWSAGSRDPEPQCC